MNRGLHKQRRIRLDRPDYEKLRQEILRRDSWRCQACGARSNLEVHHKEFRGRGGGDSEQNLITLCAACHSKVHHTAKRNFLASPSHYLAPARTCVSDF
jgi:5-methylcytosine-specific restriction endonuclease McrA